MKDEHQVRIVEIDGRLRRVSALATRENILRAAIVEIADRGYEHARLVDISERAGITVGSIYTWFKNKSDLFNAALEFSLSEQQTKNLAIIQSDEEHKLETKPSPHWLLLIASLVPGNTSHKTGPTDAQKLLIEALMSAWRDEESQETVLPQLSKLLNQYHQIITDAMATGAIDQSLDADLLARLFLAFPVGLSLLTLSGLSAPEPAAFIPLLERFNRTLKSQQ